MTRKGKLGRPRKETGSDSRKRQREVWRKASADYYRRNRKEVLARFKKRHGERGRKR